MGPESIECRGSRAVGHGGRGWAIGVPRRSWLKKSRAERPCCQHVRHTDISTACARAPDQVRLPPQTFRRMTPKRINAVLDGILDELLCSDVGRVVINVRFTLHEIELHAVYSSYSAFYSAAREAVKKILHPNNVNYQAVRDPSETSHLAKAAI